MATWNYDLFGCFGDCTLCIVTYFVPCVTAGKNAEKTGKNCLLYGCLTLLGPIGSFFRASVREEIRKQKNIEGTFLIDCCLHMFCALCALVQEAQELNDVTPPPAQDIDRA